MCILPLEIHVPALDIVVECFLYMTLIFTEMNTSLEVVLSPVYRWETRLGEVKQLAYGHMTSKSGAQRFTRQPQCTPVSHTVWSLSKRSYPTNRIFSEEALFVLASVLAGLGYFVLMLESMVPIFMLSIQKPSVSFLLKKYWTRFTKIEMLFQFLKLMKSDQERGTFVA